MLLCGVEAAFRNVQRSRIPSAAGRKVAKRCRKAMCQPDDTGLTYRRCAPNLPVLPYRTSNHYFIREAAPEGGFGNCIFIVKGVGYTIDQHEYSRLRSVLQQHRPDFPNTFSREVLDLVQLLNNTHFDTTQTGHHQDSRRNSNNPDVVVALEKFAPYLQKELVAQAWAFLAIDLQA